MIAREMSIFEQYYHLASRAQTGDLEAIYAIAWAHLYCHQELKINANFYYASSLLRLAADHGHLPSLYKLGKCYYKGRGVKKNQWAGMRLLEAAAYANYVPAQCRLGRYAHPDEDIKEQCRWYRLATENGAELSPLALNPPEKKHDAVVQYHVAMVARNLKEVCRQFLRRPHKVMPEILFDLERSFTHEEQDLKNSDSLVRVMQSVIDLIRSSGQKVLFDAYLQGFYKKRIFNVKEDALTYKHNINAFFACLEKIDFLKIEINQIIPLIDSIIDAWYRLTEFNDQDAIENGMTEITHGLFILLNRLMSKEILLDDHFSRQCTVILAKAALGDKYFVNLNSITFEELMKILPIFSQDNQLSVDEKAKEINGNLGQPILGLRNPEKKLVANGGMFSRYFGPVERSEEEAEKLFRPGLNDAHLRKPL